MSNKYYQAELTYLREMGREFGRVHPALGGMLAERGGDPDVERLLEGFAFLTGRIRERIDSAVPEVIEALCELLLPDFLRPQPAATIIEFVPHARVLRAQLTVPRGTELASVPVEGTSCRFRTTSELTLLPLTLMESVLDTPSATAPVLRVAFQAQPNGRAELARAGKLRLFIQGEYALSAMVMLWLGRHLRGVSVADPATGKALRLPADSVKLAGLEPEDALFPWSMTAPPGERLLHEYYALPSKFLFFEVHGLGSAVEQMGDKFELRFEFERPPALPTRIGRDLLKLHCVPAVNLFDADADPIRISAAEEEHLVRVTETDPAHMEIFSVDEVLGIRSGLHGRRTYRPYFAFAHGEGDGAFYRLRRGTSPINDGIDTFISISAPRDRPLEAGEEALSLRVTATNRSLPRELRLGEICMPTPTSPTVAKFNNILPVVPPIRPPRGGELQWRLYSHLGLTRLALGQVDALRAMLALHNFQQAESPESRAVLRKLESIREVHAQPARHAIRGAPVRGQRTTVELEESGFAGSGDAFLFGGVLDVVLANRLSLNSFHALSLRLVPSRQEFSWSARSGSRPLV